MPEHGFRLIESPLGESSRARAYEEIEKCSYEDTALVLPNLVMMQEARLRVSCQVLSLDRLALKILNDNGYAGLEFISRRSTGIIVEEVVGNLAAAGELEYFGSLAEKPGFLKSMANLVGQLARSGAGKEDLAIAFEAWESEEPRMRKKNSDVLKIFSGYLDYLETHKLFDVEGIYRLAIKALEGGARPPFMPFRRVYICDFYAMNSLEIEFVTRLSRRCLVIMGMSYDEKRGSLFDGARETYEKLYRRTLKSEGKEPSAAGREYLGKGREHLLKNWGAMASSGPDGWLEAFYAPSREDEMRVALARVKEELASGKVACGDVLIALPDLKAYSGLRRIADEYGVLVSMPKTAHLISQPAAELVMLALKAAPDTKEGAKAYLSLLGCGLLRLRGGLDFEEQSDTGAECFISRRSEAQAKVRESANAAEGAPEEAQADFGALDAVDSFIASLGRTETIRGLRAKIEGFLGALDIEARLGRLCKEGKLQPEAVAAVLGGRKRLSDELKELEKDYAACSQAEKPFELPRLAGIAEDALRKARMVVRNGRGDGVLVTEITNAQGMDFKSVYILGMRREEFPKKFTENWIYSDAERSVLESLGFCLPRAALTGDEYFFLSAALCARDRLTLSWHVEEGKRPEEDASPYAEDALRLFGAVARCGTEGKAFASLGELEAAGFFSGRSWQSAGERQQFEDAAGVDRMRKGDAFCVFNGDLENTAAAAKVRGLLQDKAGAYGKDCAAVFSASAFESYIKCPFAYLGEKIWGKEEFKEMDGSTDPQVEGTLLHDTLSRFLSGYTELGYGRKEKDHGRVGYIGKCLSDFDAEALEKDLMRAFDETARRYIAAGEITKGLSWRGTEATLRRWLKRWLKDERAEAILNPFSVEATEITFGAQKEHQGERDIELPVALNDGSEALLTGRIDRIDRVGGGNADAGYLRVVDYKRSAVPAQKDVKAGLDLQLALYCAVAQEALGSELKADAGVYFSLKECKRNEWLKFVDRKAQEEKKGRNSRAAQAKPDPTKDRKALQQILAESIKASANGIHAGRFSLEGRKKKCSSVCALRNICRLRMLEAEGGGKNE